MKKSSITFKILSGVIFLFAFAMLFAACARAEPNIQYRLIFKDGNGTIYKIIASEDLDSINLPNDPQRANYVFDGWYWDNGEWKEPFTIASIAEQPVSERLHMTVYAKWKGSPVTVTFGETGIPKKNIEYGANFKLPIPENLNGDIFLGWGIKSLSKIELITDAQGNSINPCDFLSADVIPQWKQGKIILTFDLQGGSLDVKQTIVWLGEKYGELPVPHKTGHSFVGWAEKSHPEKIIRSDDIVMPLSDTTLTAIWTANHYTVEFQAGADNVIGSMPDQLFEYDDGQPLNTNTFQKIGYIFDGWIRVDSGEEDPPVYQDGAIVKFNSEQNGKVILQALWKPITYNVCFKASSETDADCYYKTFVYDESYFFDSVPSFSKAGYVISSWTQTNGDHANHIWPSDTSVKNLTSQRGETVELIANWKPITYDLVYRSNIEYPYSTMETVYDIPYDTDIALLEPNESIQKEGYVFAGWKFYGNELAEEFASGIFQPNEAVRNLTETSEAVIVVYPNWKPITYTVKLHIDDDKNIFKTYEKNYDLPVCIPLDSEDISKPNHTLKGFRIGQTVFPYRDGDYALSFSDDFCTEQDGIVDLYPLWQYEYQGEGTKSSPYLVDCPDAFENMPYTVYLQYSPRKSFYFRFTADIDMSGRNFIPIGLLDSQPIEGIIDGNHHTVSNLNISVPKDIPVGFRFGGFIYEMMGGEIKNLSFYNCTMEVEGDHQYFNAGFLCGYTIDTKISNCALINCSMAVSGTHEVRVAPFQGTNEYCDTSLEDCYFEGSINVSSPGNVHVSLIANDSSDITSCAAIASVKIQSAGEIFFYGIGSEELIQDTYSVFEVSAAGKSLTVYECGFDTPINSYYSDLSTVEFNGMDFSLSETGRTADENLKDFQWITENLRGMTTKNWNMESGYPKLGERELQKIEITSKEQFLSLSGQYLTEEYTLKTDIDLSGEHWEMPNVYGIFDGNGHTISNYANSDLSPAQGGIFAVNKGTIKNLIVKNIQISLVSEYQQINAGGIAAENEGVIAYCKATGSITAYSYNYIVYVGGITGINTGEIYCCYSDCSLDGTANRVIPAIETQFPTTPTANVFGIGYNDNGIIDSCYSLGEFKATAETEGGYASYVYIGGISNTATNCFSLADIVYNTTANYRSIWAVAENLTACASQTINGVAQSTGIPEILLKNEEYLTSEMGWFKYTVADFAQNKKAAWKFVSDSLPSLYFEK